MTCGDDVGDMLTRGEWFDAVQCWLTMGGDPTLTVVMPSFIYGALLIATFITTQSPLMPVVYSLILGGVIFVAFPANALTLIVLTVMFTFATVATAATWRLGR